MSSQEVLGLETPQEFSNRLNLPFNGSMLLHRALTHRSYLNENPEAIEDNERLEFLGDAVLDYIVGLWLYNRFPEMSEGDMTRVRAALVKTEQLAEFARQISIGNALRLGKGEEGGGGRKREALLCGAFEALVGALCLEVNLEAVQIFMAPYLESATDEILQKQKDRDPKSQLQEWVQAQGSHSPRYQVVSDKGPDHDKTFVVEVIIDNKVYGSGSGKNKQEASKSAASEALLKFNGI
ncbi:MAG: ribonuclease III [Chloroflexota bacterium]